MAKKTKPKQKQIGANRMGTARGPAGMSGNPMFSPHVIGQLKNAARYMQVGNHVQGRDICRQILNRFPKHPEALILLAEMEWRRGEREPAIDRLKMLVKYWPKHVQARRQLAGYLTYQSRYAEAIAQHEKVRSLRPDWIEPIEGIAKVHENAGEFQAAKSVLQPYINTPKETPEMGLVLAKIALNEREYKEAVEIAKAHLAKPNPASHTGIELLYVVGQALEKLGDIEGSLQAYEEAHKNNRPPFDRTREQRVAEQLMTVFARENLSQIPRGSDRSERPIFIAGRPRSGSTLLERILSAHPEVHDAGELVFTSNMIADMGFAIGSTQEFPQCVLDFEQEDVDKLGRSYLEYLDSITKTAKRVTNKYLDNWRHLGLVEILWPGARVIDLRRNAIDNCFACYTVNLGPSHPFSYDLGDIGFAHRLYERMMDHWHKTLSIPMLRVDYEDLVEDTEGWARKVIDFCGLPWDDRCLAFHEHGGKGSAAYTLSYAQVKRPVYKTSVNRAEKFRKHLGPLYEALGVAPPKSE